MSLWQTQPWQDMLIASGQAQEYFVIERAIESTQDKEYAKIFVEKRQVSLGEYGLFIIGLEGELDSDTQESLQELCVEENCLFIQIETIDYSSENQELISEWKQGSYKKFIPPYTVLINLTQSEDEILAAMKQKGRYNIKLARKRGVVVEQVDKHIGNITKFHKLMSETTTRDKFAGNTLEYYKLLLESLEDSRLFFAYYENEVIAAGIFIAESGVMTYYYGVSSSHNRNLMAPYLLQWEVVRHAKKQGFQIYDFLGVAGDNEPKSSLTGVTDFKMKLSLSKKLVSNGYIYIHKKWKYRVIMVLRRLKK